MAKIPDKVTMPSNATYSPYTNLKQTDMRAGVAPDMNTTTLKSTIEVTASGRVVFRPKRK